MAHWEDFMELDSDSYTTPETTMTPASPASEAASFDVQLSAGDTVMGSLGDDHAPVAELPPYTASETAAAEDNEDNEESGGEQEEPQASGSKKRPLSEPKKARNKLFSSWYASRELTDKTVSLINPRVANRAETVTKEQARYSDGTAMNHDFSVPISETDAIINSPREYQLELFERAKKQNIIAVLDTGLWEAKHE